MAKLKVGTRVAIEGPYGALTHHARTNVNAPVLLVGAGVGSTPLRAILDDLPRDLPVDAILRARSHPDFVLAQEIENMIAHHGGELHRLVGSRQQMPLDARQLLQLIPDVAKREIFLCGPEGFMDSFHDTAVSVGVKPSQIHHERYSF